MLLLARQCSKSEKTTAIITHEPALNVSASIMADVPTLLLISAFSVFAYYLARLSSEIEVVLHHQHSQVFLGARDRMTGLPNVNM